MDTGESLYIGSSVCQCKQANVSLVVGKVSVDTGEGIHEHRRIPVGIRET